MNKTNQIAGLALANVEALAVAETMTPEEFLAQTGCECCNPNQTCHGTNGVNYSWSRRAH